MILDGEVNDAVIAYFESVPLDRLPMVQTLHQLIMEAYPKATVDLSYKMPTYRYGKGWVALANQKHYVSLYTCSAAHLEAFRAAHPGIKTGKGCINFKPGDLSSENLPLSSITAVIQHAIEQPKG